MQIDILHNPDQNQRQIRTQAHRSAAAGLRRRVMAVRGYILIEAEVGYAKSVGDAVNHMQNSDAKVTSVDTVTGPYDVIVQLEADDLDKLGNAITTGIQKIEGVKKTNTCLAVRLG
jgi:DNA-binding Lrp family transcriptional regulator